MAHKIDVTGQRFGKLIALEVHSRATWGREYIWKCLCDCGNITYVSISKLRVLRTTSCGCLNVEVQRALNYEDLSNRTFGDLKVLGPAYSYDNCLIWRCGCVCGNIKNVEAHKLKSGNTKSCGCRKYKYLIDKQFGRLTVVSEVLDAFGKKAWKCLCTCGNYTTVTSSKLTSGAVKSCGCLKKDMMTGDKNSSWKGGITPENLKIRASPEYKFWRSSVFKRDDYSCVVCTSNKNIRAHHLESFGLYPDLRLLIENGVTLCEKCHINFHSLYGNVYFSSDDFYIFKNKN